MSAQPASNTSTPRIYSLMLLTPEYPPPEPPERSSEVASLLEEIYVRPLLREGEPTIWEAEEVLLLVVYEVREALLAQRYLELVKHLGSPTSSLPVATEPTT